MTATVQPSITFLNMTGDVTIMWDAQHKEAILALVNEKMKQGYSFFILTPRKILPGNKKVELAKAKKKHLANAVGVVAPDEVVADILRKQKLDDPAVEAAVSAGQAKLVAAPSNTRDTQSRAKTADEVVQNQTVAVRRVVGG